MIGSNPLSAQDVEAQQEAEVVVDNDSDGKANTGDVIRYRVVITNTGSGDGQGVQLVTSPDGRTTLLPGSFTSSPVAFADSYLATGNIGLDVPAGEGLLANDFDDDPTALTVTAETKATGEGGTVDISADGSFTYTPPAGITGQDTFTYELNDGTPVAGAPTTDTATATITVSEVVWFVDNTAGGSGGSGTLSDPFLTLADFNSATGPTTNQLIFIRHTGTNYPGGIALKDGQTLFGSGHTGGTTLADVLPFTLPDFSASLPIINATPPALENSAGNCLTLAQNNSLRGLTLGNCSGVALANGASASVGDLVASEVTISNTTGGGVNIANGSGPAMNVQLAEVSSTGGAHGITLVNAQGNFSVSSGTITNPTGTGVLISGGSVGFSSAAAISDNSGFAAEVNAHSGDATFSGTITSTASGIRLQNNSGGTKTFSGTSKSLNTGGSNAVTASNNAGAAIAFTNGGLAVTTTSGTGLSATGGGTISLTGANNSITSSTGSAINITNTTIASNGVNLRQVTSIGGSNPGIVLNNTGNSGGLTITGNGGNCISAATCTGGSIRGKTSNTDGVSLTNTHNPHFNFIHIANNTRNGIFGNGINGFELINSLVESNADQASPDEAGILMNNLTGTLASGTNPVRIVGTTIRDSHEHNIKIENNTGVLTDLVIANSFIRDTPAGTGGQGLLLQAIGTASMGTTVTNSSFIANKSTGIRADAGDISGSFIRIDVDNSTFTGAGNSDPTDPAAQNVGVNVSTSNAGSASFMITNSTFTGHRAIGINYFSNANTTASTTINGTITGNTIGSQGVANSGSVIGNGIDISNEGANRIDVLIDNNIVQGVGDGLGNGFEGIFINDVVNAGTINATVTNNTIRDILDDRGLVIQERVGGIHCSDISGNNFSNIGGISDMRVRQTVGILNIVQDNPTGSAPNLSTVNGNADITVTGTPAFAVGTECPKP